MDELLRGAQRIAFFGGSFDPPHLGHLAIARAARRALALDAVLFAPVGTQPLKAQGASAPFEDRVAMTRLAIAGESDFSVSLADAPTPSGVPNYTIDTLMRLRSGMPVGGELFCLMGEDSFLMLRRWHRAAEIPFAAALIVASRPSGYVEAAFGDLASGLPEGLSLEDAPNLAPAASEVEVCSFCVQNGLGDSAPFYLLPGLQVEISATAIRSLAHEARDRADQEFDVLPKAVVDYIQARKLYR
jgi:nicotinate-nucleotide adenylyltransferase